MIPEEFIPQAWLNSIFSELWNYEMVPNSVDEWFPSEFWTLKKRAWLFTDRGVDNVFNRQMKANGAGKLINGGVAYFWDQDCNVYMFERVSNAYVMTEVFTNPSFGDPWHLTRFNQDSYGKRVKQRALVLPYVWWLVNGWTADKVNSTNDDGSGNVVLAVNEAAIFDPVTSLWQYIYFTPQATDAARYQIRQIVQVINDQTVYLSEQFYGDPVDWDTAEPGQTYANIDSIVVFNNIRDENWLVLCMSLDGTEFTYRNLGWNDIELFEGRFWQISSYWTSVAWSIATGEYEIIDPSTVRWGSNNARWQKMDSLMVAKNYLVINMEAGISVIWQFAEDPNTGLWIYNMTSIMNGDSGFWPDALFYKWWFYYVGKDRFFEGGDIVPTSDSIIELQVKNQWLTIDRYLTAIDNADYVRSYDFWRWIVVQYVKEWQTVMLVYDNIYKGWLPWWYNMEIYDKFELFYWDLLIIAWDKICIKGWNKDIDESISVKCVITGSKQIKNSIISLKKIKLSLGYFDNVVHNFKISVDIWKAVFEGKIKKDSSWVAYLNRQNIAAWWSSLGSGPIWFNLLGWGNAEGWPHNVATFIAKMWLIGIPIWMKCTYYKITFENLENYDLNIQWITVLLESGNPYITPLENVF